MRRGLLAGALIVLIGVGVYWWRKDRSKAATTTSSSDASVAMTGGPAPSLGSGSDVGAVDDAGPTADADPRERPFSTADAPYVNPPEIQARMTDAHAHLQDSVKSCLPLVKKKIGAHDQFRFAYKLTYRGGQARISDVEVVWSDLGADALEKCLFDKIGATTWTVTEPDWTNTAEDSLVGPDLE